MKNPPKTIKKLCVILLTVIFTVTMVVVPAAAHPGVALGQQAAEALWALLVAGVTSALIALGFSQIDIDFVLNNVGFDSSMAMVSMVVFTGIYLEIFQQVTTMWTSAVVANGNFVNGSLSATDIVLEATGLKATRDFVNTILIDSVTFWAGVINPTAPAVTVSDIGYSFISGVSTIGIGGLVFATVPGNIISNAQFFQVINETNAMGITSQAVTYNIPRLVPFFTLNGETYVFSNAQAHQFVNVSNNNRLGICASIRLGTSSWDMGEQYIHFTTGVHGGDLTNLTHSTVAHAMNFYLTLNGSNLTYRGTLNGQDYVSFYRILDTRGRINIPKSFRSVQELTWLSMTIPDF